MDLQTTNVWLAVIAIACVIQTLVLLGAAFYVMQMMRRAQRVVDTVVAETRPLVQRANVAVDELKDLIARTRKAEDSVTAMIDRTNDMLDRAGATVDRVKTVALAKIWPAAGMARGLRSVASAIRERRRRRKHDLDIEETAEERFIGEGGASARPVGTR
jgi:hypothetical protein